METCQQPLNQVIAAGLGWWEGALCTQLSERVEEGAMAVAGGVGDAQGRQ
jgi:hypothetical protein